MGQRRQKDRIGEEGKQKKKVKTAVSLLNPFLRTPDLRKLVFWYFASGTEGREVHDL